MRTEKLFEIIAATLVIVLFTSCLSEEMPDSDLTRIRDYVALDSLTYNETPNGVFYAVYDDQPGDSIRERDVVAAYIEVFRLDGVKLDSMDFGGSPLYFRNTQNGIYPSIITQVCQFLTTGDKVKMIIPGAWAYGIGSNLIINMEVAGIYSEAEMQQIELGLLEEYAAREELVINDSINSSVKYTLINQGVGELPTEGQRITVSYTGRYTDGTVFDRSQSFSFNLGLGNVISSWDLVFAELKSGASAVLYTTSDYAYDDLQLVLPRSLANIPIPPYSPLVFEVEVIRID